MEKIDAQIKTLQHNEPVSGVRFTPDGKHLVSLVNHVSGINEYARYHVWDVESGDNIGSNKLADCFVYYSFTITDDNRIVVRTDKEVIASGVGFLSPGKTSQILAFDKNIQSFFVDESYDSETFDLIVSGNYEGEICFWGPDGKEEYKIVKRPHWPSSGQINDICTVNSRFSLSPYLIAGTNTGVINIWNIGDVTQEANSLKSMGICHKNSVPSTPKTSFGKYGDPIRKLIPLPNYASVFKLLSCSMDHLRVWTVNDIEEYPFDYSVCSTDCTDVEEIAVIPCDEVTRAVVGTNLKGRDNLTLWNLESLEQIGYFEGHTKGVRSVDVSPDGKFIASASADGTVIVWETPQL